MVVTELAVFNWDKNTREMMLTEVAQGHTVDEVRSQTESEFTISPALKFF